MSVLMLFHASAHKRSGEPAEGRELDLLRAGAGFQPAVTIGKHRQYERL